MSTFTEEIETRSAALVEAEEGTIEGVAVPWNQAAQIGSEYLELFERGSVEVPSLVRLRDEHSTVIGRIVAHEDREEGLWIRAKVSDTAQGRDVLTLLRDGALAHFSIGFRPGQHRDERQADGTVLRTRTSAHLLEVSVVPFPAYERAEILSVRSEAPSPTPSIPLSSPQGVTPMESPVVEAVAYDDSEIRSTLEEIERRVDTLGSLEVVTNESPLMRFGSFGEYIKAVAAGQIEERDYTGIVSADTVMRDGWIGEIIRIIEQRQTVLNLFSKGNLPADGMVVEYAQIANDSIAVTGQGAPNYTGLDEGANLIYGELDYETKTAPVKTLGGWTSLSRQAIERSALNVVDDLFRALALRYGRAVENEARARLVAAIAAADSISNSLTDADDVVDAVVDFASYLDDRGLSLDGIVVDKATFKSLLHMEAPERILKVTATPGENKIGSATLTTLSGNIANVPVVVNPGAVGTTFAGFDSQAIRVLESPGAPFRLQDDNIVNLSRDFSVYGYVASFTALPDGVVKA